ncbi:unnamed protein product [Moneuplotes crassus]|uniref:Uncharacterized protein n=1 Tax=Euplotes crassus TaxID=5936 RepID=A0AAD1U6E9_EUPCR|nr:unnamed protein product [Moneuplotes crassus]
MEKKELRSMVKEYLKNGGKQFLEKEQGEKQRGDGKEFDKVVKPRKMKKYKNYLTTKYKISNINMSNYLNNHQLQINQPQELPNSQRNIKSTHSRSNCLPYLKSPPRISPKGSKKITARSDLNLTFMVHRPNKSLNFGIKKRSKNNQAKKLSVIKREVKKIANILGKMDDQDKASAWSSLGFKREELRQKSEGSESEDGGTGGTGDEEDPSAIEVIKASKMFLCEIIKFNDYYSNKMDIANLLKMVGDICVKARDIEADEINESSFDGYRTFNCTTFNKETRNFNDTSISPLVNIQTHHQDDNSGSFHQPTEEYSFNNTKLSTNPSCFSKKTFSHFYKTFNSNSKTHSSFYSKGGKKGLLKQNNSDFERRPGLKAREERGMHKKVRFGENFEG